MEMWRITDFLILTSLMNLSNASDQCGVRMAPTGTALKGFVFKWILVKAPYMCDVECEKEINCQSYNYVMKEKICELNKRTKEARPEHYRFDPARFYARRLKGRALLGSIKELPARSCQEIKASEGKNAIYGRYWLDPTNTGKATLYHCDMFPFEFRNCAELYKHADWLKTDGVYTIKPDQMSAFDVYCDQTTAGGGWTVFQKRLDGSVDFNRNWSDYKRGFGDLNGEFWLGLDKIHRLTSDNNTILRIDLEDFERNTRYAEYKKFCVKSENYKYKMSYGSYSGDAGNSLGWHRNKPFSTRDQDNDDGKRYNCAVTYKGAWWYASCHDSNLNGLYHHGYHSSYADGVNWNHWKGHHYSLKRTEMKIRPVDF
ncbi:microfibril-associated glycoprotein 4-like [Stylophora pistillata]|uniref:microfibril-associated glycoprotein 4-like n=1 Tax=Stylophora pistillata TaxID=50429 RepID=UPI000C03B35C|nr:microfibril-associated glycoprotein 4-like [Stylophora pistillata]XP_022804269.1 microfibril-associated glycoprotein 4-like [Stylophora pistillata]